jgi:glucose-6-phosphate 1-dehydrogenase
MPHPHFILVIFGASGDLAEKKLLPALHALASGGFLGRQFAVLGTGRTSLDDQSFRAKCASLATGPAGLPPESIHYQPLDLNRQEDFFTLRERLEALEAQFHTGGNIVFYLAVPPGQHTAIVEGLAQTGLNHANAEHAWRRIIIEKPFGHDLASALALNRHVLKHFGEEQIFRIDHYLGKETVQNLLVMRFANGIFEPLWNRNYIRRIEISSAEMEGIGTRSGYYEKAGALRDMLQNHLLQLVALTAMEPPATADSRAIRNETLKVFQSLRPLTPEEIATQVVRGQYIASRIRGENVQGYRQEKGVHPESRTETFVAMKLFIDNWRWNGVPFLIRSGKRLPTRVTEIVVHFRQAPHRLFQHSQAAAANQLVIRIQPDEGLLMTIGVKIPGTGFEVRDVGLDFHYSELSGIRLPDAYERLLLDCIQGDSTLYLRSDAMEATWRFIDPILQAWEHAPELKLHGYPAGTWGPEEADRLVEPAGESWRQPCRNLTADNSFCEL